MTHLRSFSSRGLFVLVLHGMLTVGAQAYQIENIVSIGGVEKVAVSAEETLEAAGIGKKHLQPRSDSDLLFNAAEKSGQSLCSERKFEGSAFYSLDRKFTSDGKKPYFIFKSLWCIHYGDSKESAHLTYRVGHLKDALKSSLGLNVSSNSFHGLTWFFTGGNRELALDQPEFAAKLPESFKVEILLQAMEFTRRVAFQAGFSTCLTSGKFCSPGTLPDQLIALYALSPMIPSRHFEGAKKPLILSGQFEKTKHLVTLLTKTANWENGLAVLKAAAKAGEFTHYSVSELSQLRKVFLQWKEMPVEGLATAFGLTGGTASVEAFAETINEVLARETPESISPWKLANYLKSSEPFLLTNMPEDSLQYARLRDLLYQAMDKLDSYSRAEPEKTYAALLQKEAQIAIRGMVGLKDQNAAEFLQAFEKITPHNRYAMLKASDIVSQFLLKMPKKGELSQFKSISIADPGYLHSRLTTPVDPSQQGGSNIRPLIKSSGLKGADQDRILFYEQFLQPESVATAIQ